MYSFVIIMTLTLAISWVKQTRTRKEFFIIMFWVTVGLAGTVGFVVGLAKLLEVWGVAESGFIF